MGNCFGSSNDSSEYQELDGVTQTPKNSRNKNYGAISNQESPILPKINFEQAAEDSENNSSLAAPAVSSIDASGSKGVDVEPAAAPPSSFNPEGASGVREVVEATANRVLESQEVETEAPAVVSSNNTDISVVIDSNIREEISVKEQVLKLIYDDSYDILSELLLSNQSLLTEKLFDGQSLIRFAFKNKHTHLISFIYSLYSSSNLNKADLINEVYEELESYIPNEYIQFAFDENVDILKSPYIQLAALVLEKPFIKDDCLISLLNFYVGSFQCPEDEFSQVIHTCALVYEMLKEDERATDVFRKILENYDRNDQQIEEFVKSLPTEDLNVITKSISQNKDKTIALSLIKLLLEEYSNRSVVIKEIASNNTISVSVIEYMIKAKILTEDLIELAVQNGFNPTLNTKVKIAGNIELRPFISTINRSKCEDETSLEHKMVVIMARSAKFKEYLHSNYEKYMKLSSYSDEELSTIKAELKPFNRLIPILTTIEEKQVGFIGSLGLGPDLSEFLSNPSNYNDTGSLISFGDTSLHSHTTSGLAAGYGSGAAPEDTHTLSGGDALGNPSE